MGGLIPTSRGGAPARDGRVPARGCRVDSPLVEHGGSCIEKVVPSLDVILSVSGITSAACEECSDSNGNWLLQKPQNIGVCDGWQAITFLGDRNCGVHMYTLQQRIIGGVDYISELRILYSPFANAERVYVKHFGIFDPTWPIVYTAADLEFQVGNDTDCNWSGFRAEATLV